MSVVIFPFKYESPELLIRNVRIAAAHPRVEEVIGVAYEEEKTFRTLHTEAPAIEQATGKPVQVMIQDRIGKHRPGKGDAMNTALLHFLEETGEDRIHFYDADIATFDSEWITKAEAAADQGYQMVRHYFPRAPTDGMVTWMIARTGFALLWPRSSLPWIEQPLGGELLLTREAAGLLAADADVLARSDWGVDTLYTFSAVRQGLSLFETYLPTGKVHKLYGRLTDLRPMVLECLSTVQSLQGRTVPEYTVHRAEYPDVVPQEVAEKVGYGLEATLQLLERRWTDAQVERLGVLPERVARGIIDEGGPRPRLAFMDESAWYDTYRVLLQRFSAGDEDWEEVAFHLWMLRVLHYTIHAAIRGHGYAQRYLHGMLYRYLSRASSTGDPGPSPLPLTPGAS